MELLGLLIKNRKGPLLCRGHILVPVRSSEVPAPTQGSRAIVRAGPLHLEGRRAPEPPPWRGTAESQEEHRRPVSNGCLSSQLRADREASYGLH